MTSPNYFFGVCLFQEADLEQSHPATASLQAGDMQMAWRGSRWEEVQQEHRRRAQWTETVIDRVSVGVEGGF